MKRNDKAIEDEDQEVAPCAGAWIETRYRGLCTTGLFGRPLRGGVD